MLLSALKKSIKKTYWSIPSVYSKKSGMNRLFRFDSFRPFFPGTQEERIVCFPVRCVTFPPALAVTGAACALMCKSKLCLPVCHCQWITWTAGTASAGGLEDASAHMRTHFIYCADRCLCTFGTCVHTRNTAHSIIPVLLCKSSVVLPKKPSGPDL